MKITSEGLDDGSLVLEVPENPKLGMGIVQIHEDDWSYIQCFSLVLF